MAGRLATLAVALGTIGPRIADAAPPAPTDSPAITTARYEGRVLEGGGSRAPVSGAVVMLVDADEDVRPGRPARPPLDPEAVTWLLRAETDADGRFVIPDVPIGMARVVVVAGGYGRLEQWTHVAPEPPAHGDRAGEGEIETLYVTPEVDTAYRTEVAVERERLVDPPHAIDGREARHYAGSGDDPVLVTLNLPGVARSPGGFGLLSARGADPRQTGVYVDGHPVPRAFHVIPIAGVMSPPLIDRVELSPGNYGPGFGSFSGGMIGIWSRPGGREGVHGEAHIDLFDVGTSVEAPVADGSMHFGLRRSHVDGVIGGVEAVVGDTGILLPTYWDYLGRFDYPVTEDQRLTVRALGAGDRLRSAGRDEAFDFAASFHRFDLDYLVDRDAWRVFLSPSLRLDSTRLESNSLLQRNAWVVSTRLEIDYDVREWVTLQLGSDVVFERWRRRRRTPEIPGGDLSDPDQLAADDLSKGQQRRLGIWAATSFRFRGWELVPSLRFNAFAYAGSQLFRVDPRLHVRGEVHPKLEVFTRIGAYSIPVVVTQGATDIELIAQGGTFQGGVADIPPYLITYFDPGIEGEVRDGAAGTTTAIQASTGFEAALPWELALRTTLFWREVLPTSIEVDYGNGPVDSPVARQRAMGAEVLLRRSLARYVDGWIGYTLTWARERQRDADPWLPAVFDQRHNFVVLLSAALPRGFRIGARFRVVTGNPEEPVIGVERVHESFGPVYHPIRGPRGTTRQPLFHQLDLRVDKRWTLDRTAVSAYLDVQNIYDRRYPEVWLYTADWSERVSLVGLPIYPSLGVQVEF